MLISHINAFLCDAFDAILFIIIVCFACFVFSEILYTSVSLPFLPAKEK